jgi:hypothetical protein
MRADGANPRWRLISATAEGPSHTSLNQPNQDRQLIQQIGHNGTWVFAVADGAGSRARSGDGATIAVEAAAAAAEQVFGHGVPTTAGDWLPAVRKFAEICLKTFDARVDAFVRAQARGTQARRTGESPDGSRPSYATTLLAVVSAPPFFGYLNVGDCFLVVDRDPGGPHLVLTAPEREHAGETVFMTSRRRDEHLTHGVVMDARIRGLALCTDGLCEGMLTVRQAANGRLHSLAPPEFSVYFDHFGAPGADAGELTRKIESREFAETSGDDKTIVLAVRTS